MREFNVKDLHKEFDPYIADYDEDYDEVPDNIDNEGHFEELAAWAIKAMGFKVKDSSHILERHYTDGWIDFECKALGGKSFKAKLDENAVDLDYYQHYVVERSAWSLEDDGSVTADNNKNVVLCVSGVCGGEKIFVDQHEVKQCPYMLYYDQVYKEVIKKVDIVLYVKVQCADEQDELSNTMEDAISDVVHDFADMLHDRTRDYVEDNVDYDVYYEGEIDARLHKHKVTDVKRLPN